MNVCIYRRLGGIINAVDPQPGNWFWFCFVFVSCVRACVRAKLRGRARACASHRWWPECPDVRGPARLLRGLVSGSFLVLRKGFKDCAGILVVCARVLRILIAA